MFAMHKKMGFGFPKIAKTAINHDGYLGWESHYSLKGFATYLESVDSNRYESEITKLMQGEQRISDCITYDSKYICITPPMFLSVWSCDGDAVDKVIHGYKTVVEDLRYGIPNYRYVVERATNRRLNGALFQVFMDLYDHYVVESCDAVKWEIELRLLDLAESLGFDTIDDVLLNVLTFVPDIVKAFTLYLNLFKDSQLISQMHPLLCIYWR
jgi:hypothetical protein